MAAVKQQFRNPNVEQELPAFGGAVGDQGISNAEADSLRFFPSTFDIRYSTCPLCPHADPK
jgi:hypothetical protein